jgi:hypothetical protein
MQKFENALPDLIKIQFGFHEEKLPQRNESNNRIIIQFNSGNSNTTLDGTKNPI